VFVIVQPGINTGPNIASGKRRTVNGSQEFRPTITEVAKMQNLLMPNTPGLALIDISRSGGSSEIGVDDRERLLVFDVVHLSQTQHAFQLIR
jgi:hypothetical protein